MPAKHMLARKDVTYSPGPNSNGEYKESEWDDGVFVRYEGMPEMRVGEDYQAVIPTVCEPGEYKPPRKEGLLVWSPDEEMTPTDVDSFIQNATGQHGYNVEQALGMLFWHKYDVGKATEDLSNFVPLPDEFNIEDRVMFEQGYRSHGKSFHRIKEMMPDKSMGSLIRFYYTWKKGKHGKSEVERHVRDKPFGTEPMQLKSEDGKTDLIEGGHDNNDEPKRQRTRHLHVKRMRRNLLSPPLRSARSKRLPKGMFVNRSAVEEHTTNAAKEVMESLTAELNLLKTKIQACKQAANNKPYKCNEELMALRPALPPKHGFCRWSNDEFRTAIEAVRRYGRDFQAIADIVGKTVQQCRNFFMNYRKKFDLDQVVEEYRARVGRQRKVGSPTEDDTHDQVVQEEEDKAVEACSDVSNKRKPLSRGEKQQPSKRPRLDMIAESLVKGDNDSEEIAKSFKAEAVHEEVGLTNNSTKGKDHIVEDGTAASDLSKENQSRTSKSTQFGGRSTEKVCGRSRKH